MDIVSKSARLLCAFLSINQKNVLTTVAISCILSSSHNVTLHVITIDYVPSYARFYKRVVPSMLIVSQHMLRETELEAPEAYRGKVRLYSIRYKSDDCEVEGYAAVPAQFEGRLPLLFLTAAGTGSLGPLSPRSSAVWPQQAFAAIRQPVPGQLRRHRPGGIWRQRRKRYHEPDYHRARAKLYERRGCLYDRPLERRHDDLSHVPGTRASAPPWVAAGLADSFTMYYRFDGTRV